MEYIVIGIFIFGYLSITLEYSLKLDKTIIALIMASLSWAIIAFFHLEVFEVHNGLISISKKLAKDVLTKNQIIFNNIQNIENYLAQASILEALGHHLKEISEIIIFLISAMTIVEIIDLNKGFIIISRWISTTNKRKLLWITSILGFILSAIIDNLAATIVLITILKKIILNNNDRLWYVSAIVIATNAGGAWSPIGDVTTTILWISHKVSSIKLIQYVLVPSIISMIIPIYILQFNKVFKGSISFQKIQNECQYKYSPCILYTGIFAILFTPIFKMITHLPPYIGMIFSLGIICLVSKKVNFGNLKTGLNNINNLHLSNKDKFIKKKKLLKELKGISLNKALSRIEMSSILFFLGILLAVGSLESLGFLFNFSKILNTTFREEITVILLGITSAIIDNVPLVAASLGMFQDAIDSKLWHFIAFAAGTGGSMLIIGSASGVAAMGIEKINFSWYLKNISLIALIGFLTGSLCFIFLY